MSMSPKAVPPVGTREYKVLRAARAPPSASNVTASSASAPAASGAPVPIPIPGQPLPNVSAASQTDDSELGPSRFVLYEAVPSGPLVSEQQHQAEEPTPEMQEFQDMLSEYLRGEYGLNHSWRTLE